MQEIAVKESRPSTLGPTILFSGLRVHRTTGPGIKNRETDPEFHLL